MESGQSLEVPDILVKNLRIPEFNNTSTNSNNETPSSGLFLVPSTSVLGRPSDITGYLVSAANELGKLEFVDQDGLLSLKELSDVSDMGIPSDNQILQYDLATDVWNNQSIILPPMSLNLSDVDISVIGDNQVLQYNSGSGEWTSVSLPPANVGTPGIVLLSSVDEIVQNNGGDNVIPSDAFNEVMGVNLGRLRNIELVATANASNSATIELTWMNDSSFQNYFFIIESLVPVNNNVILQYRVSIDGGSSYENGALDYETVLYYHLINTPETNTSSAMRLSQTNLIENGANQFFHCRVFFSNPNDTTQNQSFSSLATLNKTNLNTYFGFNEYNSTSAVNGLQWFLDSGNISSGSFRLYRY